eukprot:gene5640-11379_t
MSAGSSGNIVVSERQRGNPLLQYIKNVQLEYNKDIIPDYVLGTSSCALFVSIKYHLLHPLYIHRRIKELGRDFRLRVVIVLVDVEDNINPLNDLNKICFSNDLTLVLSWSNIEAARYIETFKVYETRPATSIQEREESEFLPRLSSVLTTVKPLNKTDAVTLLEVFGSFKGICSANEQQLLLCPGLGEKKVERLYQALHEPFHNKRSKASSHSSQQQTVTVAVAVAVAVAVKPVITEDAIQSATEGIRDTIEGLTVKSHLIAIEINRIPRRGASNGNDTDKLNLTKRIQFQAIKSS